jgi:O-antigen/teichoic acid export membrane protein
VSSVGGYKAALIEIALFGGASLLVAYTSRRKSNLARELLVGASALLVLPYLVVFDELLDHFPVGYISLAQVGLQAAAIYFLFTPQSRAWFAGRRIVADEEDD